jgi:3-oxoacyl-[acyl-carrier-protein] synthase-1
LEPLILSKFTLTSAVGCELKEHEQALLKLRSGLGPCNLDFINLDTCVGRVKGIEDSPVVDRLKEFDCRNNRLAQLALHQDEFEQACYCGSQTLLIDPPRENPQSPLPCRHKYLSL